MKMFKNAVLVLSLIIFTFSSCTSPNKAEVDDEFATDSSDSLAAEDEAGDAEALSLDNESTTAKSEEPASSEGGADEFAEFEEGSSQANAAPSTGEDDLEKELNQLNESAPAEPQNVAQNDIPTEGGDPTLNQAAQEPAPTEQPAVTEQPVTDQAMANPQLTDPAAVAPMDQPAVTDVPPPVVAMDETQTPPPEVPAAPTEAPLAQTETPVAPTETPVAQAETPIPQPEVPAAPEPVALTQINGVRYQSNENGGAVVIDATQPVQFTTRLNSATNQLVVEVQNSVVPKKLKRSLNTKDMASSIGSVDIYQKANSKISRFVIQLRPGSPEPLVQPEGNSLLIVGAANPAYAQAKQNEQEAQASGNQAQDSSQIGYSNAGTPGTTAGRSNGDTSIQGSEAADLSSDGILSSHNLEDFLANNNKFYGKRISLEANKLDLNEAFRFLAEESNVNMIIDDGVAGDISIKLKQVPWDQAFVLILKSKKLGYRRQGNVLRIATMDALIKEEEEALKLIETRRSKEPTIVKRFFISYAEIGELATKIREFVANTTVSAGGTAGAASTAAQGRVISDKRTSSLIVTDTPTNMAKIEKLIQAIDTQPKQVLIEGKVVEAQEKFTRGLGIDWRTGLRDLPTGAVIQPSTLSSGVGGQPLTANMAFGRLSNIGLGSLDATLRLGENESKVRVLSAPRISVLSNETANISQKVTIQVPSTETTTTTGSQTAYVTKDAGVTLSVTPQIANEGTVVMDLDITRSFLGDAAGSIESRNAKTKVIVKSGQTAVIGGIFQADTQESGQGIPFLRNIPVLGYAFGGKTTVKSKNELVIFVTPKIQKPLVGDAPASSTFE